MDREKAIGDKPVIEIENLSFAYDGTLALEQVNFTVYERDFISIVGPNAGGKTTLLKLILGLLQPRQGNIRVFGTSPDKARSRIGYMPQRTTLDPLFPVSVMDVVLMGRLGHGTRLGFYSRADRLKAREALQRVEMDDFGNRPFSSLSGGQSQRVLIARALAVEPAMLLLDEPTANVDVAVENEFYELLKKLNDTMTIVLVTHDLGFASHYVTHVACVNRKLLAHPTCEISGEMISALYGSQVHMIRHDEIQGREDRHD